MATPNDESATSNKSGDNSTEDANLAELLDSTLDDFGKTIPSGSGGDCSEAKDSSANKPTAVDANKTTSGGASGSDSKQGGYADDPDVPSIFMDPAMAQKAATDFTKMIQQLAELQKTMLEESMRQQDSAIAESKEGGSASAEGGTQPSNAPISLMDAVAGLGPSPAGQATGGQMGTFEPGASGDEQAFAAAMLENLNMLASKAQLVGQAKNEHEFQEAIEKLHEDETFENEFLPFMGGLMGTLLSKDMLYPSMSEIVGKYPEWIETHKAELSPEDLNRYQNQLEIMKEICTEYEQESDDDPEDARAARFQKIVVLLQQMQALGQPPKELAGDMPPGWSLDGQSGLPTIVDQGVAAENCSVM